MRGCDYVGNSVKGIDKLSNAFIRIKQRNGTYEH